MELCPLLLHWQETEGWRSLPCCRNLDDCLLELPPCDVTPLGGQCGSSHCGGRNMFEVSDHDITIALELVIASAVAASFVRRITQCVLSLLAKGPWPVSCLFDPSGSSC